MKKILVFLGILLISTMAFADDIIIPAAAFFDDDATGTLDINFSGETSGTGYIYNSTTNSVYARAGVYFPADATGYVYKFYATVYDFSTAGEPSPGLQCS